MSRELSQQENFPLYGRTGFVNRAVRSSPSLTRRINLGAHRDDGRTDAQRGGRSPHTVNAGGAGVAGGAYPGQGG